MTELDDPFVLQNFTAMLQKIMQEDGGTWEALGLMDELKITSPGFGEGPHGMGYVLYTRMTFCKQ